MLYEALEEGAVVFPLSSRDKWEAIEECLKALPQVKSGEMDFDEALKSIREREDSPESTMLDNNVAIPHGIMPDPSPLVCALGIHPEGVVYNEKGDKAQLMIVMLGSMSVRKSYFAILAQIARHFRSPELKEKLLEAGSANEVIELIKEAEKN